MTATPRPWQIIVDEDSPLGCIFSPGSETVICTMTPNGQNDLQVKHDAELIVHAVNTFDEAKAALADAISYFEDAERLLAIRDHVDLSDSLRIGKNRAKAVLAKLEGA